MTERTAGLRGLTPFDPARHARFKYPVEYGFLIPAAVYPIDKRGGLSELGMDGNGPDATLTVNGGQPCSDCGAAAVPAHVDMTTGAIGGLNAPPMSSDLVVTIYFTYQAELAGIAWRPPALGLPWSAHDVATAANIDNGVDLGDWLLWLFNKAYIEGFLALTPPEVDGALDLFDAVVAGVSLTDQDEAVFNGGGTWDVSPSNRPDPNLGHAIDLGYVAAHGGECDWATWGQWQPSTDAWRQACAQQYFAVLTKEQAEAASFPFAQLVADLKALGGTVVTPPAPTPQPSPTPPTPPPGPPPTPAPTPNPVIAEVEKIATEAIKAIVALVKRIGGTIPQWSGEEEAQP